MRLKQWLKKEGKTVAWLAKQLGISRRGAYTEIYRCEKESRPLPYTWIPKILEITNGEVNINDEWSRE